MGNHILDKNRVMPIIRSMAIAIAALLLFVIANRIIQPCIEPIIKKDLTVEIVATGDRNQSALDNNVRIASISVNNKAQNISRFKLTDNWQYNIRHDFLYAYSNHGPSTLSFPLTNVMSLDLNLVSERGSGIVDIYINGDKYKTVDLFSDSDWTVVTCRYIAYPFVELEKYGWTLAIIFLLFFAACLIVLRVKPDVVSRIAGEAYRVILHYALSFVIVVFVSVQQYLSVPDTVKFFSEGAVSASKAIVFIFLLMSVLFVICRSTWLSFVVAAIPVEILSIISSVKTTVRGNPLLPWDIHYIKEVSSVLSGYKIRIPLSSILCVVLTIEIAVVLFILCKRKRTVKKKSIASLAVLGALIIFFTESTFIQYGGLFSVASSRRYQPSDYYNRNGFITAYLEYFHYFGKAERPADYDKEKMQGIALQLQEASVSADRVRPNIIVIMSESFWDITRLSSVEFAEEPLPVYRDLLTESKYGRAFSHVFNGGTNISEFEFLTGFSGEFFPEDYIVFGDTIDTGFFSAVSVLEAKGYDTLAIHPYIASNYNRNVAYEKMGFDNMLFDEDFSEDAPKERGFISDEALTLRIEQEYEEHNKTSDAPYFVFAVSMQNHGGYFAKNFDGDGVEFSTLTDFDETTVESMEDYFAGLNDADKALGDLVEYFRQEDEDTVIIFFGDHMADAGGEYEKMLSKESWYSKDSSSLEMDYEMHWVPFLIWSNFDDTATDMGAMEIGQLLPLTFDLFDVGMPPFWQYVLNIREAYVASDKLLFIENDFSYDALENMTQEQKDVYETYWLLQYDYIWGERYVDYLWDPAH